MDDQPAVFSGTLKVRACHVLWTKTPVQLTYHRQDYRHALPVLLIRRPSVFGGEFRVPLDPCVHPVRLLPTSEKMSSKFEFVLEYGWHTKQVRLRAPDADTYRQWTNLVAAALESGRRPLPSCCSVEQPRQDLACSSLATTLNSSNNSNNSNSTFNVTIRRRVQEEEEEEEDEPMTHFDEWQHPSDFFVLHQHPDAVLDDHSSSSLDSAAIGSCTYERDVHPILTKQRFKPSPHIPMDYAAITRQLFLQTRFLFFLL